MLGFALLWNLRLWDPMVTTLVMVVFSTAASIAIGLPLGIAAALSPRTWRVVAPSMDMAQTMPSFVYLILPSRSSA